MATRTRVVFLQHPRESRVRIGTARMAHLSLPNSALHVGLRLPFPPDGRTAVLFPGAAALPAQTLAEGPPWTLVVVDGTWPQARKIVQRDPVLGALPRIGLTPTRPGNYRIRREPSPECLATVEAVAAVLGEAEGGVERFEAMLQAFTEMVDRQLSAAADRRAHRRRPPRENRGVAAELAALADRASRLVLVHGEANAHPRGAGVPGAAELLHLVARRVFDGERCELVLAPRRPLASAAAFHLGLPEAALRGGLPADAALARLRAFLRPEDVLVSWGRHPLDLLRAEGLAAPDALDLRALVARRLRRRPGPPQRAAEALGVPLSPPSASARAAAMVAALGALVTALLREAAAAKGTAAPD